MPLLNEDNIRGLFLIKMKVYTKYKAAITFDTGEGAKGNGSLISSIDTRLYPLLSTESVYDFF